MLNKEQIIESIKGMPENASFEEILERIYFLEKIQKAKLQVKEGKVYTHEEVKDEVKKWLK